MTKKVTLGELGGMMEYIIKFMSTNMATKEDIAELKHEMTGIATKEQMFALQTQVNSIEGQIRRNGRLEVRVSDLEEKVFGEVRA